PRRRAARAARPSPAGRRYAEAAAGRVRSFGEHALARPARARFVRAEDVLDLDHVRRGRDTLEVELRDLLDVVEDARELARHPVDLVLGEAEAGEAGDVEDLIAVDHAVKFKGLSRNAKRARAGFETTLK